MHAKFQAPGFNGVGGEWGDRLKEGQTTLLDAIHNGISNSSLASLGRDITWSSYWNFIDLCKIKTALGKLEIFVWKVHFSIRWKYQQLNLRDRLIYFDISSIHPSILCQTNSPRAINIYRALDVQQNEIIDWETIRPRDLWSMFNHETNFQCRKSDDLKIKGKKTNLFFSQIKLIESKGMLRLSSHIITLISLWDKKNFTKKHNSLKFFFASFCPKFVIRIQFYTSK